MGDKTGISWTHTRNQDGTITKGATWNPVSGCTKLTAECKFCYVERDWHRLTHLPAYKDREFTDIACHEDRLDQPLRWHRGRRIFVCSTSDLFHSEVPDEFIDQVFAVMSLSPQHTFLILTKRSARMLAYLSAKGRRSAIAQAADKFPARHVVDWVRADGITEVERGGDPHENAQWLPRWPLPNVQIGVTAGTQQTFDERVADLVQTPAATRWVSMEPLLESVDVQALCNYSGCGDHGGQACENTKCSSRKIDWGVAGGESGPRARPMHPAWARSIRDKFGQFGVGFYFKQHGEWGEIDPRTWDGKSALMMLNNDGTSYCPDGAPTPQMIEDCEGGDWVCMARLGRSKTGELLDGVSHYDFSS